VQITDPVFVRKETHSALDRFALRFIRDERDLPFIHLSVTASLVLFPLAALLFAAEPFRWWYAPIYWAILLGFFFDRYILMLHNTSHRPLFKKEYGFLNQYIPWVLGPFCGESPETYFAHHMGMHHAENNMYDDLSSTLRYQRDNPLHFAIYFLRFFLGGFFELTRYFAARQRWDMMRRVLIGELTFYTVVVALFVVAPAATFTVFIFPFIFCRFGMMAGNWAQHAFVDGNDPENNYRNSLTCINTRYNRRCFNDGYHIGHHLRANRHWTDLPVEFQQNVQKYHENAAIVFDGIDFFQVWALLMMHRYRTLASHMVDLGPTPRTEQEKIDFLRSRLRPIPRPAATDLAGAPA
jgi:fatty acid desaturase